MAAPPPSHFKGEQDQELIRLALHKSPFFTCLDEEQVERFVSAAELKTFPVGEIVIQEGCVDEDQNARNRIQQTEDYDEEVSSQEEDVTEPAEPDEYQDTAEQDSHGEENNLPKSDDTDQHEEHQKRDDTHENIMYSNNNLPVTQTEEYAQKNSTGDMTEPPPPRSGIQRSLYIVRRGNADVWYQERFNPASLGPGTLFGEGGFLFGRRHSASVVAGGNEPLECWVVDIATFRQHVLPSTNMTALFNKYATQKDENGVVYMTMEDFVQSCEKHDAENAPSRNDPLVSLRIANTYNILRNTESGSTKIYIDNFCFFHLLMARPDPEVDIAFLLMDKRQTGQIYLYDLAKFLEPTNLNLRTEFFTRYFGKHGTQSIRHPHFSQFLVDLQSEMGKQAFLRSVEESGVEGYLPPMEFVRVLKSACGWRLPDGVASRLESIYCDEPTEAGEAAALVSLRSGSLKRASPKEMQRSTELSVMGNMEQREKNLGERYFAYGDFVAFQEVLANLPGICNLIDKAQEIKQGPVSPDDFKVANRVMGLGGKLSRRQVDLIFQLFDLDRDGFVSHEDTVSVCGVDFARRLVAVKGRSGKLTFAPPPEYHDDADDATTEENDVVPSIATKVTSFLQHFGFTALSGAVGIALLYPLDLMKTRLQNQRLQPGKKALYKGALDCFQNVIRAEGYRGLYRGLTPQLIGVAPEKIIKLKVNDLVRQAWTSPDDNDGTPNTRLSIEALAGACAGACQLLVTNPMEITKIRLQMQGETDQLLRARGLVPPERQSFLNVARDLGFPGVYRGASACLIRDIPFSAIYFPTYTLCKDFLKEFNDGKVRPFDLLAAGTLAGVPAAFLTSPADVIKTRLQTIPLPGEAVYSGIRDCAIKVYRQEGVSAFFQGSMMRVLRIAPQFGISLLAYEQLVQWVGLRSRPAPPTNAFIDPSDYRTAFPARALHTKTNDIDSWMRSFGRASPSPVPDANNNRTNPPKK